MSTVFKKKINYWKRIFEAYILRKNSHLNFWHEKPMVNTDAFKNDPDQYYMTFFDKTQYQGLFDENGIPLLDYQGTIGKQYNPIAIAQYGLGHFNIYKKNGTKKNLIIAFKQADWLVAHLETNTYGVGVWMHHFDWEYRTLLKAPWYSALAQGNGISLLVRIYKETKQEKYFHAAQEAFKSLEIPIEKGGVLYIDKRGNKWLEETIVDPPTHILNGFLWTLFGIWDYYLLTKDEKVRELFNAYVNTLKNNLHTFDIGFWSLYEHSGLRMKMIASRFYHALHIVQLEILYTLTNEPTFNIYCKKWEKYSKNIFCIMTSQLYKACFKLIHY